VALAQGLASLLARVELPLPLPFRLRIEPDWRLALYATLLAALATFTAALLPAWQSLRQELARDLPRETGLRVRGVLVAGQLAVSVVVLATGLLFLRNLVESSTLSPGFDLQQTLRAVVFLPAGPYGDAQRKQTYVKQALEALSGLPGLDAVAAARVVPFNDSVRMGWRIRFPDDGEEKDVGFHWNAVSPDYFRAMSIPIHRGRAFQPADETGRRVVIVNQPFVDRYLGARPPIGCVFLWGSSESAEHEVVGVAGTTKNLTLGEVDQPQLYELLAQIRDQRPRTHFVMRSATPPSAQVGPVRRALRALEPAAGAEVAPLQSSIGLAFLPSQVGALLLGSMGALGLLLACVGLYGVSAYAVERRQREIGVRVAIGATRARIAVLVLRDAGRLMLVGAGLGLAVSVLVTRPLAMFLVPGLGTTDPLTLVTLLVVLMLSGLAASWVPMRRALSVDPCAALRSD
jgi:predicted permease